MTGRRLDYLQQVLHLVQQESKFFQVLSSDDAKKVYTNCTAAVLRAKDCVMKTATTIQENAEDIYAEAVQINEDRAAEADAKVEESLDEEVSADEEGAE